MKFRPLGGRADTYMDRKVEGPDEGEQELYATMQMRVQIISIFERTTIFVRKRRLLFHVICASELLLYRSGAS